MYVRAAWSGSCSFKAKQSWRLVNLRWKVEQHNILFPAPLSLQAGFQTCDLPITYMGLKSWPERNQQEGGSWSPSPLLLFHLQISLPLLLCLSFPNTQSLIKYRSGFRKINLVICLLLLNSKELKAHPRAWAWPVVFFYFFALISTLCTILQTLFKCPFSFKWGTLHKMGA